MKQTKKILAIVLAFVLSISMIPTINVSAAKKVKLNKTKVTIYVGKTVTLKLRSNKRKVKWSSSNKKVATVSKKGKVKGKKAGKATITAKVGKKKYKCKITVKKKNVKQSASQTITQPAEESTAKPIEQPTTKQQMSISDYYATLKNYIITKGTKTSDVESKYSQTFYINSTCNCSLIYNKNTDMYRFEVLSNMGSEKSTIWFNMSKTPIVKYQFTSEVLEYTAISNFEGAKYTWNDKTTVGFTIKNSGCTLSTYQMVDLANSDLKVAFTLMDRAIYGNTKISLGNLGMTDYHKDVQVNLPNINVSDDNATEETTTKKEETTKVEEITTAKKEETTTSQEDYGDNGNMWMTEDTTDGCIITLCRYYNTTTEIVIPNKICGKIVVGIGRNVFSGNSMVQKITIPSTVTSIGDCAFQGCSSLGSITIPNTVTSIGDYAFNFCSSLGSITIPNSVTSIGKGAFCDCESLYRVTISSGVQKIEDNTFKNCSKLSDVTIPSSVTSIGGYAFMYCSKLEIIRGEKGSYAEKWAKNKGYTFIAQ